MSSHFVVLPVTQIYTFLLLLSHTLCCVTGPFLSFISNFTATIWQFLKYTHVFHSKIQKYNLFY
jgi:hypothetical protein